VGHRVFSLRPVACRLAQQVVASRRLIRLPRASHPMNQPPSANRLAPIAVRTDSLGFCPYSASRFREPLQLTSTASGLPPTGFLTLSTVELPEPSGLVSCRWRSWGSDSTPRAPEAPFEASFARVSELSPPGLSFPPWRDVRPSHPPLRFVSPLPSCTEGRAPLRSGVFTTVGPAFRFRRSRAGPPGVSNQVRPARQFRALVSANLWVSPRLC
jgi:hypothetical protein